MSDPKAPAPAAPLQKPKPVLLVAVPTCPHCGSAHADLELCVMPKALPNGDNCYATCPVLHAPLRGKITVDIEGQGAADPRPLAAKGKSGNGA